MKKEEKRNMKKKKIEETSECVWMLPKTRNCKGGKDGTSEPIRYVQIFYVQI